MSEPVKIIVSAETAEAAANLKKFLGDTAAGFKFVEKTSHDAASGLGANRAAIMEIGHSARAMAEGLAFGMNPMRLMMLEAPRLAQSLTEMNAALRASIVGALPVVGGIAAGFGLVELALHGMRAEYEHSIERANALTEAYTKQAEAIKNVALATKAGLIGGDDRNHLLQLLGLGGPPGAASFDVTSINRALPGVNAQDPLMGRNDLALAGMGLPTPENESKFNQEMARLGVLLEHKDPKTLQPTYTTNPEVEALAELMHMREHYEAQMETDFDKHRARAKMQHDEELRNIDIQIAEAGNLRKQIESNLRNVTDPTVRAAGEKEIANLDPAKLNDARVVLEEQYQDKLAAIDKKEQEKKTAEADRLERQLIESQNKIREEGARQAREELRAVEDQITADQDRAGGQRAELIQQEYKARVDAAERAFFSGQIEEAEYTHLLQEAAHKRTEAEKEYNAQLERTAQLKKQIAQYEAEARLHAIEQNDGLTGNEKAQQSVPIWQNQINANLADIAQQNSIIGSNPAGSEAALNAQLHKNELLAQNLDLQKKIDAAVNADNFSYQIGMAITKLRDMGTLAQQVAASFDQAWVTATNSVAENLSKVVQGTETWRQAMVNIYNTILNDVVTSIIKMAEEWILQHTVMELVSTLFGVKQDVQATTTETAKTSAVITGVAARLGIVSAGEEATKAIVTVSAEGQITSYAAVAAAAAYAAMADIPYVGPELGLAAMGETLAEILGVCLPLAAFAQGGLVTGPGTGTSDSIHARLSTGEFVVRADAVQHYGIENMNAINNLKFTPNQTGSNFSSSQGNATARHKTDAYVYFDSNQLMNHLQRSDAHEKLVVDIMGRNIHRFR